MTNEQLYILLMSMTSELRKTFNQCHQLMPEDAPKEIVENWRLKPEFSEKLVIFVQEEMKEYYSRETGHYEALVPLRDMIDDLETTAKCLVKLQETQDNG